MTNTQAIKVLNMVEAHGSLVIQAKDMAIKALQAQSDTGYWKSPKDIIWENPKCSECGFESADHDNYCPHCGVAMSSMVEVIE